MPVSRYFMYGGRQHHCLEGPHIVNIFSFSKAYGMMGWRVGYIAYPNAMRGLGVRSSRHKTPSPSAPISLGSMPQWQQRTREALGHGPGGSVRC